MKKRKLLSLSFQRTVEARIKNRGWVGGWVGGGVVAKWQYLAAFDLKGNFIESNSNDPFPRGHKHVCGDRLHAEHDKKARRHRQSVESRNYKQAQNSPKTKAKKAPQTFCIEFQFFCPGLGFGTKDFDS